MDKPNRKDGASAPSNIVRLPTAAPRRIKQNWSKINRDACLQMREGSRWPSDPAPTPEARKAVVELAERDTLLSTIQKTPELALCVAILGTMSADRVERVANFLAPLAMSEIGKGKLAPPSVVALALIETLNEDASSHVRKLRRRLSEVDAFLSGRDEQ